MWYGLRKRGERGERGGCMLGVIMGEVVGK